MKGLGCWVSVTSLLLMRYGACAGFLFCASALGQAPGTTPTSPPPPSTASVAGEEAQKKTSAAVAEVPFRITGRVIDSLSKAPVRKAEVRALPMGARRINGRFAGRSGAQPAEAVTDAEGRFSVEVPSAGGWSLSVTARGYHTQAYEEHDGFSTAVILTEANPVHDLVFPLTPASAIEGFVADEAGEAVRNARVTVSLIPPATPDDQHPRHQVRGNQQADDRGYYKFFGLLPGNYEVRVQAQPWYATSGSIPSGIGLTRLPAATGVTDNLVPDTLDVVYPVVWYPGVTDYAAASPISLRAGETKEADFRMIPIPGFHLWIAGEPQTAGEDGSPSNQRFLRNNVSLSQVLPDGTDAAVSLSTRMEPNGAVEFSGLAPGTYLVHGQDGGSTGRIRIAENSARTLDANQMTPEVPVALKVDEEADTPSLQISFRDMDSGRVSFVQRDFEGRSGRRGRNSAAGSRSAPEDAQERSIDLEPGRYEVTLSGINDLHLTGIEATGATAAGRTVTITGGAPLLTLHVAGGRANLTGFVQAHGKSVEGAMVLLVPATLGDRSGLTVTRRDQSNTDGSFDIGNVLPGAYILVAIDHGWDVNWSDPATLRLFLMHGVPLDLSNGGERKETVEAQLP